MDILKKIVGREVKGEKDYFDAVWHSIHTDGKLLGLGQMLERSAKLFPENIALVTLAGDKTEHAREISYKELYFRASKFSDFLKSHGIKPRDRVLLFIENSAEFFIGYYGIVQTGAVIAPLNTFLIEAELNHIMKDSNAVAVVTTETHRELFKQYQASNPQLKIFTQSDMDLQSPVPQEFSFGPSYRLDSNEMAALLYTSGTTGLPKGVMLSSKNIMSNLVQTMARFNLRTCERVLGVLPLFHSFAQNTCVWATIFTGSSVIIVPKIERRHILEGLRHQPTIVLGVPALFGLFCMLKNAPFDSVKYFAAGGDAMPDKIRMGFGLLYRRKIVNGYGLTEASPVVAADFDDVTEPTSNIGRPLINIDFALIDADGNKVAQGDIGQLTIKSDNVMLGYYNAPEMTAGAIKDGWLYTGDLAYEDEKGKLVITGRSKDIIKHKGFIIYPQEIENVLLTYSNVIRAGVVGKPDIATGEISIAFVQIRTHENDIEKKLKDLCMQHLALYKIPKEFIVSTHELPLTTTGKVDKKVLRKKLQENGKN